MAGDRKRMVLTGRNLKWIGIASMTLDHIGAFLIGPRLPETAAAGGMAAWAVGDSLYWWYLALRAAGRLALPVFCFLLTEGFVHTKNKRRYLGRLAAFAVLSEIPFDLAVDGHIIFAGAQNMFVTLLLGLLMMERLEAAEREENGRSFVKRGIITAVFCLAAEVLRADYGAFAILLTAVLYLWRNDRKNQSVLGAAVCIPEVTAPLAFLFIRKYGGGRGSGKNRYFFYWYYPLHLAALTILNDLL